MTGDPPVRPPADARRSGQGSAGRDRQGRTTLLGGDRGQSSVDFMVAAGVFFVAVTTVVAFMPTIIQPFTDAQANPLLADRLVMQLVDNQLGDPTNPSVLNVTCTMYFLNESAGDPCPTFDATASIHEKLGIDDRTFVNVTIQQNVTGTGSPETVCADSSWREVGECGTGDFAGDRRLDTGDSLPPGGTSVTAARRKVLLGDEEVFVIVRVWQ